MENLWLLGLQGGTWEYMGVLDTKRRYCWALLGNGVHLGVLRYWGTARYCEVLWDTIGYLGYWGVIRDTGGNCGVLWVLGGYWGNGGYGQYRGNGILWDTGGYPVVPRNTQKYPHSTPHYSTVPCSTQQYSTVPHSILYCRYGDYKLAWLPSLPPLSDQLISIKLAFSSVKIVQKNKTKYA